MKRHILMACCLTLFGSMTVLAQTPAGHLNSVHSQANPLKQPTLATGSFTTRPVADPNVPKTMTCTDTLRYAQVKEIVLGSETFYAFGIWESDNEAVSQTFLNSVSHTITGIEFYGGRSTSSSTASITVRASVYNVDANNNPTTLLGSGTVAITGNNVDAYRRVTLGTPVTVTGNYALVLDVTSAGGVARFLTTDWLPSQTYDEDLTRYKSSYYVNSSDSWVSTTTLTTDDPDEFADGTSQFDALIAPIVSYSINTSFTVSDVSSCLGEEVTFTNTTTPAAIISNRMYNYQSFNLYFGEALADSSYVWLMDTGVQVWAASHDYTYATAGAKTPNLITFGGFWSSCTDLATTPITVNALPTVSAGTDASVCQGTSTTLTASGADTYSWDQTLGAGASHSVTPSNTTTYTVTGTTTATGCQNTDQVTVTVTPLDNAGFAYTSNTLCTGGGNETPTVSTAGGTFSSTAGLVFVSASTGEIDMATTADGTYSVTYTTAGTCPNSSSQNITITSAPDATFTYAQATYCGTGSATPSFGAGASAGAFSSTTGLVINPGTGAIDLAASTAGTYTVTNTIAAAGVCPASSATFDVTITAQTVPTFAPIAAICNGDALTLPATSDNAVPGTWSPAVDNTTTTTYTFTPAAGQCATTATMTVTVNQPVTPAFTAVGPYCEGATIPALATTSNNAITGTWSPATVSNTASGTYTFTPTAGQCATTATLSVTVNSPVTPTFAPAGPYCEGTTIPALPTSSTNSPGITGTWSPAINNTATTTYTFTPAGSECATTATLTITINDKVVPTFNPIAALCKDATAPALATSSTNTPAIPGTWSPATISTATVGTTTYTFTPAAGQCAENASLTVTVNDCLGLDENVFTDLQVFPNPTTADVTVSFTNTTQADVEITVVSNDGKVFATRTAKAGAAVNEHIDMSTAARGVYFIRLTTDNGVVVRKVAKQ